jgi:hypothetical protein
LISFKKYWGITVDNVKVGSKTVVKSFDSIVDTGTTLIILDTTAASAIYKDIKGAKYSNAAGMWEVPCKSLSSLPDITFTINGKPYPLTPKQYTVPSWQVGFQLVYDLDARPIFLIYFLGSLLGLV